MRVLVLRTDAVVMSWSSVVERSSVSNGNVCVNARDWAFVIDTVCALMSVRTKNTGAIIAHLSAGLVIRASGLIDTQRL